MPSKLRRVDLASNDDRVRGGNVVDLNGVEKNEKWRVLVQQFFLASEEILAKFGKEGLASVLGVIKQKGPETSMNDVQEILEGVAERAEVQKFFFDILENENIISYDDQGEMIVDIENLTEISIDSIRRSTNNTKQNLGVGGRWHQYYQGSSRKLWYELFRGKEVISKEDYGNGIREPKPLFYAPETKDQAFDVEAIKKSKFYLGLWNFRSSKQIQSNGVDVYPSTYDDLDYFETELACKIYHPQYGAGYRDEASGRLMVKDKKGKFRSISGELLNDELGWNGPQISFPSGKKASASFKPVDYLYNQGHDLLERDLIRTTDFRTLASYATAERYRQEKVGIGANGYIMLNSVKYFLGRNFSGQPYKVYEISPQLGGVVRYDKDGNEKLEYIFNLFQPGDKRLKKYTSEKGITYGAPAKIMDLRSYKNAETISQLSGEVEYRTVDVDEEAKGFQLILELSKVFSKETGVNLARFAFLEQTQIVQALKIIYENHPQEVINFVRQNREGGLRMLVSLQADGNMADEVLKLARTMPPADMCKIVDAYNILYEEIGGISKKIIDENKEAKFSRSMVQEGLLVRSRDFLATAIRRMNREGLKAGAIQELVSGLRGESVQEKAASGHFRKLSELMRENEDSSVDFQVHVATQESILKENPALYVRALHERGELKPVPEIHWRVDRGREEYRRRFGFDVVDFLKELSDPEQKKVLLEFGPGSGKSKQDRMVAGVSDNYYDFAMADAIYYPVNETISRAIDWEALQNAIGSELVLSEKDKNLLSDLLYKAIMIADGEIEKDDFGYNKKRIAGLTKNPRSLPEILQLVSSQLEKIHKIPSTISTRNENGEVVYPYKQEVSGSKNCSLAFLAAKIELGRNITQFIRVDKSIYEIIPAYPSGTMVGDFSLISTLKSDQIDVALGVRSTVYKRGEEYIDFVITLADKLKSGGVWLDDSIRDNDGWYYRLAELSNAEAQLKERKIKGEIDYDISMNIILGPGFPGEDHRQDEVPLAIVMGKNKDYSSLVGEFIGQNEQFKVISLDQYIENKEKLRTLDSTGHVLNTVNGTLPSAGS